MNQSSVIIVPSRLHALFCNGSQPLNICSYYTFTICSADSKYLREFQKILKHYPSEVPPQYVVP
eukprot:1183144-Prorocentrum_minimum.AAC.2